MGRLISWAAPWQHLRLESAFLLFLFLEFLSQPASPLGDPLALCLMVLGKLTVLPLLPCADFRMV
jgi:hypothetical protein